MSAKNQVATTAQTPPAVKGKISLVQRMAERYAVENDKLMDTLKNTAFKPVKTESGLVTATEQQLMALLVVADQYHLNPFTREIYAFPAKGGGIVPVVGIDGWIRIINTHPDFDYMTHREGPEVEGPYPTWDETEIKRFSRSRPTVKKERYSECYRNTDPWNQMPSRMLRWKSIAQCARVAFGFVGIYDPDEADRIVSVQFGASEPKRDPPQAMKPLTIEPKPRSTPKAEPKDEPTPEPKSEPDPLPKADALSVDQMTAIRDKLKETGVKESALLATLELGFLEEIPAVDYKFALDSIDELR